MKDRAKNRIQMRCWKLSQNLENYSGYMQHNYQMPLDARDASSGLKLPFWSGKMRTNM